MGSPSPAPPPPPPKWIMLRRVPQVCHDLYADFSVTLAEPPRPTELVVSPHLAPDGVSADCFPLVHAADPSGILIVSATYDRCSMAPPSADKQAGDYTTNYFAWHAAIDYTHRLPPHEDSVKHTGNVGLVVDEYNFMVAELLPAGDGDRASLLCYWSYDREWVKKTLPFPLKCPWSSARTFSHQGKLWWLDLSQGLLCCDPFAKETELLFVPFPDDIDTHTRGRDVGNRRCVNLSNGALWLAEMTYHRRALFVKMWKLGTQGQWTPDYTVKFADIWADRSYKETGIPKKKPALVAINPDDPEVLYFSLEGNLLQVNMCAKRVELCVAFRRPTTDLKIDQGSSQFILTWNLPTSIVSSSGRKQEERSSRDSAFDMIADSFTNACASVLDDMEFNQLAMTAIEYLNQSRKEEKVKFRLSERLCQCYFDEEEASTSHRKQYIHMNFYVHTESERLPQLVFAEFVEANRNDDCSWDLLSCKTITKNSPGVLYNTNVDVGQKRKRSLRCYACEGKMKHPSSGFSAVSRTDASYD
ncbi:uncharacterized protein [Triticum aestivum]|uniref:uncharacterized protein isoform X2 n=1 Tax=Triticum aestivum TaxID=4565 RepID=UPI001D0316E6|nr:uncharacterized protein LOC123112213 isoform X2 [Triticum aestivum]